MRDYTKIEAWRLADDFTVAIYETSRLFARGSLTESQYFVHLAQRLGYLADPEASKLEAQGRQTFACLFGLIRSVEKETGKFGQIAATITSLFVLGIARLTVTTAAG